MKTHQNNFHKEALLDLTSKFVKFSTESYIPEEYRTLFEYFKMHYKNSNKGIKGRGKARKIAGGKEGRSSPRKATSPKAEPRQSQQPSQESMYAVTSGHGQMVNNIPRAGNFAPVFTVDGHNHNGLYEDEDGRQIAFDGLY